MKTKCIQMVWLLAAALSLGTLSCKKQPQEKEPEPPVTAGEVVLDESVPLQGIVFGPEAGEWVLSFKATKAWSAAVSESWARLSAASGNAGDKINIRLSVSANEDYDDRTASVRIDCEESSVSIPVTQKQKGAIVLAPESVTVPAEGATLEIKLLANVTVTASADVPWIAVAQTKGLSEYAYSVEVAPNEGDEPRTGKVTFSSESGSETLSVTQEAAGKEDGGGDEEDGDGEDDEEEEDPAPEEPGEDPTDDVFGDLLETVTESTVWAGSVFDAIIDAGAPGETEYTSPDGENFVDR